MISIASCIMSRCWPVIASTPSNAKSVAIETGASTQSDAFGARYGLREDEVAGRIRLPRHGEVFADPHLGEPELVAPFDDAKVLFDTVSDLAIRRVRWLHEHPVAHRRAPSNAQISVRPGPRAAL